MLVLLIVTMAVVPVSGAGSVVVQRVRGVTPTKKAILVVTTARHPPRTHTNTHTHTHTHIFAHTHIHTQTRTQAAFGRGPCLGSGAFANHVNWPPLL